MAPFSEGFILTQCLLRPTRSINKDSDLGKPNYSFQKRQKELAKKQKKEEKKLRKLEKQDTPDGEEANPSIQKD